MTEDITNKTWFCKKYEKLGHMLISSSIIKHRVLEMSVEITKEYKDKDLVCIIVLEGASVFASDILRYMSISNIHPKTYSIAVKSYNKTEKKNKTIWTNISTFTPRDLHDKYILIIEDIIDTGKTLKYLYDVFSHESCSPKEISVCSLLNKNTDKRIQLPDDLKLKFIGFNIPDVFVIGYGLDCNYLYRNLPFISVYKDGIYTSKKEFCDNTDCTINHTQELFFTTLTSDFDYDTCWWCKYCIEKNKDMIEYTNYKKDVIVL